MQTGLNNTIAHTSWHLMNFMICQISGYCFRFAFENELSDLRNLVHPDSFCELEANNKPGSIELELNLLDSLADPAIRIMLQSIEKLIACRDMLALVNNLDMDKLLPDLLAIQLGQNICEEGIILPQELIDYKALHQGISVFYYEMGYQIYLCTEMFDSESLHVISDEAYARFSKQYMDILLEQQVSNDKNIDLLYKLMIDLGEDSNDIQDLKLNNEQN